MSQSIYTFICQWWKENELFHKISKCVLPFPHTLSNISFSMKYVRPAFSQFSSTNAKICLLGVQLGTRHQIQVFQGFSWISSFAKIVSFKSFVHSLSSDNNLVTFHLWWRKIVLKRKKVYKYFVQDCSSKK